MQHHTWCSTSVYSLAQTKNAIHSNQSSLSRRLFCCDANWRHFEEKSSDKGFVRPANGKLKWKSLFLIETVTISNRFCLNTSQDQLIKYYGYEAEVHKVTTADGYILTLFRCNSKNSSLSETRKPVIVQHGLLVSSDDFCINVPSQALGESFLLYSLHCDCSSEMRTSETIKSVSWTIYYEWIWK